jgi:hypothetical protein
MPLVGLLVIIALVWAAVAFGVWQVLGVVLLATLCLAVLNFCLDGSRDSYQPRTPNPPLKELLPPWPHVAMFVVAIPVMFILLFGINWVGDLILWLAK